MWWAIGIGGFLLYLLVAFTLGLMTLRNGHGWMFFFGIFFPDSVDLRRLHEADVSPARVAVAPFQRSSRGCLGIGT